MKDEFRAQYVNGPEGWHVTFPDNERVHCVPGPGRLSRLGFVDWEVLPRAASFLMRPMENHTRMDVEPEPVWLAEQQGMLMVAAMPHNVHFDAPVHAR